MRKNNSATNVKSCFLIGDFLYRYSSKSTSCHKENKANQGNANWPELMLGKIGPSLPTEIDGFQSKSFLILPTAFVIMVVPSF